MEQIRGLKNLSEVQFVNPSQISKHLECPICSCFFFSPFRLDCGHTFCKECISMIKKTDKQSVCPECRSKSDLSNASQDLVAQNLIEEQLVFCLNKPKLCSWRGQLCELHNHLKVCSFKESDEESRSLVEKFDKKIQQTMIGSDLNVTFCNQTHIDEKLQENINKNVGESLLMRLLNKDKDMARHIVRQISSAENSGNKSTSTKMSQNKKETTSDCEDSTENFQENEDEIQTKEVSRIDEHDELLHLFSGEEEPDEENDDQKTLSSKGKKNNKAVGRKKRVVKKKISKKQEEEEEESWQENNEIIQKKTNNRKVGKKRSNNQSSLIEIPLPQPQPFPLNNIE